MGDLLVVQNKGNTEINNAFSHDISRAEGGLGFVRKFAPATCVVFGIHLFPSL